MREPSRNKSFNRGFAFVMKPWHGSISAGRPKTIDTQALYDAGWKYFFRCGCTCPRVMQNKADPKCPYCQGTGEVWMRRDARERGKCDKCAGKSRRSRGAIEIPFANDGGLKWWVRCLCQPTPFGDPRSTAHLPKMPTSDKSMTKALLLFIEQTKARR